MYYFTSESVSEGHPDKIADAISDTVLDCVMDFKDQSMRCACETMVTTNKVIIGGEYKCPELDWNYVEAKIRDTVKEIGYEQQGFHWRNFDFSNLMHDQSSDIALGTDKFGAGDQGLMFGYATNEAKEYMPSAIYWSHVITRALTDYRKQIKGYDWLGPDNKSQVTMQYDDNNKPVGIDRIVCSTQHSEEVDQAFLKQEVEKIIRSVIPPDLLKNTWFYINPTGRFVIGGPDGDAGVTGRKIIVDTYGGYSPHGGGAFSGKDPSKVDRSAAYMARWLAKNIVASGQANTCSVQLAYAIGEADPMSVHVTTDGSVNSQLSENLSNFVDLTPKGIIDQFELFRPIYQSTTNYGHFGKANLPWEMLNLYDY